MPLEIVEALQQEKLAEALIQRLKREAPHHGVLEPTCVLVQNAGLGRWLQLWHARKSGISAGLELPFARSFIAKTLEGLRLFERQYSLDEGRMKWLIFAALVSRRFETWGESGEPLRAYLSPGHPNLEQRCWQLAGQVAELFDQYAIYRPKWLYAWLNDPEEAAPMAHWGWQSRLFNGLMNDLAVSQEAFARRIFGLALHHFTETGAQAPVLPRPLHLFGMNSFSPAFLKFFLTCSQTRPVTVYHLVCSEAFLGELPVNYRHALLEAGDYTGDSLEMPVLLDNPYLIANGQATARFQSLLLALDYPIGGHPLESEEEGASDLKALQISLRQNEPTTRFEGDGSVSFHACHSRIREVQVLQQQLLALFAADPDLRPEEILVLAPEIKDYGDAIESVFSQGSRVDGRETPVTIPYCIADRLSSKDENCWRFFETFLNLLKGRQVFSEVSALLDFDPVCERLQISRDEMQELFSILQAVGIRWGVDARTRMMQAKLEFEAYSWDYGLQRLYDGILLPDTGQLGCAPYPVSGRMAEIIGNLTQLLRPAFEFVRTRNHRRSFSEWVGALIPVLRGFVGEEAEGCSWARILIPALGRIKEDSVPVEMGFDTFCTIVGGMNTEVSGPSGLLRRGVTFCRLQPARHIPAKVICVLGMNDGAYPRRERRAEFDLRDLQRRRSKDLKGGPHALKELHFLGDHRLRDEDRQLFLDCILNAKERLYISYVGQSDKSNAALPPSLLISELQQFLRRAGENIPADQEKRSALLDRVIVRHPLQEWSRGNFNQPQPQPGEPPVPIHFDTELATLRRDVSTAPSFLEVPSNTASEEPPLDRATEISAKDLNRFLKDPARHYLKQRLLVDLNQLDWEAIHQDWEDLEMDTLNQWQLRERLLEEWLVSSRAGDPACSSPSVLKERLELDLTLPPGLAGRQIWSNIAEPLLDWMTTHLKGEKLNKERSGLSFDSLKFVNDSWTLTDGRRLVFINSELKSKSALEAYLLHIGSKKGSLVLCLKDKTCFDVPATSSNELTGELDWLHRILRLYAEGNRQPLPFSLEIGTDYVKRLMKNPSSDRETALRLAYRPTWGGNNTSPAQRLCFDNDSPAAPTSPWRDDFMAHSEAILRPVLMWEKMVVKGKRT